MYARVPQAMAQFVLKIEKLSHIMAPTPILEMARAYCPAPDLTYPLKKISLSQNAQKSHKNSHKTAKQWISREI